MPHNGKNGRIYTADGAGGERVLSTPNSEDRLGGGVPSSSIKLSRCHPYSLDPQGNGNRRFQEEKGQSRRSAARRPAAEEPEGRRGEEQGGFAEVPPVPTAQVSLDR